MAETVQYYGSEVWSIKEDDKHRGDGLTPERCWYIRGTKNKNKRLREQMRVVEHVIHIIEIRNLKWFGHILEMPDTRSTKQIF